MDILDLFGADPAVAQSQAKALEEAMRRRRAAGTVASIIGGPFAGAGRAFLGDADQTQAQLGQVGQFRAQQGLQREQLAQNAGQFQASQAQRAAELATSREEAARRHAEDVALRREALAQGKFSAAVDPITGATRIFDTRTGTFKDEAGGAAPGGPAAPRMPNFKSAEQANAYAYAGRIREARKQMEEAGYPSGPSGRWDSAAMGAGGLGPASWAVPQEASSEPGSRYFNAARNMVAALLRKESGAAIGKDEWAFALNNYVPTPMDSPELRANKLKMLDIMENGMVASAGASGAQALQAQSSHAPTAPSAPALSPQDAEAKAWADANPNDPRSAAILKKLGGGR